MQSRLLKALFIWASVSAVLLQGNRVHVAKIAKTLEATEEKNFAEVSERESRAPSTCTLAETGASEVKYGINLQFTTSRCIADCNPIKILSETIPATYMDGKSMNDKQVCKCSSKNPPQQEIPEGADKAAIEKITAANAGQFLFAFTPPAGQSGCDGDVCWEKYKDLAGLAKMKGASLQAVDFFTANHFITNTPKCSGSEAIKTAVFRIPSLDAIKEELIASGDTETAETLGGMAMTEDPEVKALKAEEIAQAQKDASEFVVVHMTEKENAGIGDDAEEEDALAGKDLSKMSEEELLNAAPAPKEKFSRATNKLIGIIRMQKAGQAAPKLERTLADVVLMAPTTGTCSRPAKFSWDDKLPSKCGPIETKEECEAVSTNQKVTGDGVQSFSANTLGSVHGCVLRRTGAQSDPWHAVFNSEGTEQPAWKKGGSKAVETRLLCGCYRDLPAGTFNKLWSPPKKAD